MAIGPAIIHAVHPDYCMASWHRFYIDIWRVNTTIEGVRVLKAGFAKFAAEHPGGVGLLTIVEPRAPLPPSDARDALAAYLAEAAASIKYSAVVFEGDGFRAAAVRGVVTGLTLLARPPYPHKVFANVQQAVGWFSANFMDGNKPVVGTVEMVAAINELRKRIGSGQPRATARA